ncbi:LysR family transcriptional regulator [Massilia sp. CF038]|uniref:LysR family transcriptional regulator n=1 Tax=Massilia sp. CF038 TaxID=1881045 RepID=UPI0009112B48|nr:LysR family transcriptional regulator [Massilia sp. CF038]SHG51877.1 DNA-binding transcriptional regulator, LysR family [Massilia sp. CF038]
MNKFQEMQSFVAVVGTGSFVRAAAQLATSKAAISRHVADLEQRLGVRLLNRTTRKLSMTDEGQSFYLRCTDLLHALEEAENELSSRSAEAAGQLRISAPLTFGIMHLAPLWGQFLDQHPKVTLDLALTDRTVDLVEDGLDLAIRIAATPHPTLIARKLASTALIACASPAYLRRRGVPQHPHDLRTHDVISYSYFSGGDDWTFTGPDGQVVVKTQPRLHANNGETCVAAALQHQGIILQPAFLLHEGLRSKRLKPILPAFRVADLDIFAVYASRRQLPHKLRYMIDFLVEQFQKPVWHD